MKGRKSMCKNVKKKAGITVIVLFLVIAFMPGMSFAGDTLPAKYDLRNVNGHSFVTPVKQQGDDCWTFATIGAIESAAIKAGLADTNVDYSEAYLEYFTYHGYISNKKSPLYGDGQNFKLPFNGVGTGSLEDYIGLITSRAGIVNESKYPFVLASDGYLSMKCQKKMMKYFAGKPALRFIKNPVEIKSITSVVSGSTESAESRNAVKQAIIDNGNADVDFAFGDENDLVNVDNHWSYYYAGDSSEHHVVDIVGWDDNYDARYFGDEKPDANGAWLCKNSWGTGSGEKGYFWLSYYTPSINNILSYQVEPYSTYDAMQTYNGGGYNQELSRDINSTSLYEGNIFKAQKTGYLAAVGLNSKNTKADYTIKIYTSSDKMKNPVDGTLVSSQSGNMNSAEYTTIPLKEKIELDKNTYYSIIVKYDNSSDNLKLIYELGKNRTGSCRSFYSLSGSRWVDCSRVGLGDRYVKALVTYGK
jgi:C1A family cysteine protease